MNVRGINPLIATILLLLVSLAIAGLLYSWLSGYTTEQTAKASEQSEEDIELCRDASFRITKCELEGGGQLRVTLENTGDKDLNEFIGVVQYEDGNITRFTTDQNVLARSFLRLARDINSSKTFADLKVYPKNCPDIEQAVTVCED